MHGHDFPRREKDAAWAVVLYEVMASEFSASSRLSCSDEESEASLNDNRRNGCGDYSYESEAAATTNEQ